MMHAVSVWNGLWVLFDQCASSTEHCQTHSKSPVPGSELEAKLTNAILGFGSSHRVCALTDEPRSENSRLGIWGA